MMNNQEAIDRAIAAMEAEAHDRPAPMFADAAAMAAAIQVATQSLMQICGSVRNVNTTAQAICYFEPEHLLAICMFDRALARKLLGREGFDEVRMKAMDKVEQMRGDGTVNIGYNLFNQANHIATRPR